MKKSLILFIALFSYSITTLACDGSESVLSTFVDNGDGTYDATFSVCFAGEEASNGPSYGFYIDITGANIIGYSPSSVTSSNGTTIDASASGGYIEFGDYDNDLNSEFVGQSDPQECFSITLTLDALPTDWEIGGQELYDGLFGSGWCNYTGTFPEPTLPVELTHFTGTTTDEGEVELEWQTASEFNSKHFVVERSEDGITFEEIAIINSAENSYEVTDYQYTDNIAPGENAVYYRLKQVDLDNSVNKSDIISVNIKQKEPSLKINYLSLNSSKEEFNASIYSPEETNAQLYIFNLNGKVIYQEEIQLKKGENMISENIATDIYSSFFVVKLIGEHSTINKKITVNYY